MIWIGYILIVIVIISGSAFVPLGVALDVENPLLKVSWRISSLLPFLSVLGVIQALNTKENFDLVNSIMDLNNLFDIMIAAISISLQ